MDVLVVRHGIAMPKEEALERAIGDRDRPLTDKGRSRMKRIAKGIRRTTPVISIFTSPLLRAIQTAEILAQEFRGVACTETPALVPEADPDELVPVLADSASDPTVAIVGHEPHLSRFVTWCLADAKAPIIELKKGGACLLRFEAVAGKGRGRLIWLAPPAILRHI